MSLRCLILGHDYEFYGILKLDRIKDIDMFVAIHKCHYCDRLVQVDSPPPKWWPMFKARIFTFEEWRDGCALLQGTNCHLLRDSTGATCQQIYCSPYKHYLERGL